MDKEIIKTYFGSIMQKRLETLMALMHVAVDVNQKEWFDELCEEYNRIWGL